MPEKIIGMTSLKNEVLKQLLPTLEPYKAKIKQRHSVKPLEHLMMKLGEDLTNLYKRKEKGEKVDIVIRNKLEKKRRFEKALAELQEAIIKEKQLTLSTPIFIGAIYVKLAQVIDSAIQTDEKIERIGMEVAMVYEKTQERVPQHVSQQNLGSDICSLGASSEKRYLKEKARGQNGPVALTQNECFKAKRFGKDYYLYVVYSVTTEPEFCISQDSVGA